MCGLTGRQGSCHASSADTHRLLAAGRDMPAVHAVCMLQHPSAKLQAGLQGRLMSGA